MMRAIIRNTTVPPTTPIITPTCELFVRVVSPGVVVTPEDVGMDTLEEEDIGTALVGLAPRRHDVSVPSWTKNGLV